MSQQDRRRLTDIHDVANVKEVTVAPGLNFAYAVTPGIVDFEIVSNFKGYISIMITKNYKKIDCNVILNHNFTHFVFDYISLTGDVCKC